MEGVWELGHAYSQIDEMQKMQSPGIEPGGLSTRATQQFPQPSHCHCHGHELVRLNYFCTNHVPIFESNAMNCRIHYGNIFSVYRVVCPTQYTGVA